jgi:aminopeptidase N
MNRHAKRLTWDWLTDNWEWLVKNLGTDLSFFRMPNYAARNFSDTKFLKEFIEFFEGHMSPSFERPVKQAVETIEWQAAWRIRDLEAIIAYLKV